MFDELHVGMRGKLSLLERTLSEKTRLAKHWNDETASTMEHSFRALSRQSASIASQRQDSTFSVMYVTP